MLNFFKNKRKLKYIIVSVIIIAILLLGSIIFTIVSTQTQENDNAIQIAKATEGYSATNPYVPIGFTHTEGTWDTGFVIKESSTGNEFVWIPVNGTNLSLARRDFPKDFPKSFSTMDQCSDELNDDFNASVGTYKGFYIGRYEAGVGSTSGNNVGVPVCKKGATVWTNISRDNAKASAEKMYQSNKEVFSSLASSYAYDTMLTWFKTQNYSKSIYNVDTDSSSWGNYKNTSNGSIQVAGNNAKWKANNIYDIAGNVWEWTTENCSNDAVVRGGDALSNGSVLPAGTRDHAKANSAFSYTGFRVLLYRDVNAITETKLQVIAGSHQSAYINGNNKLYMCGRNNLGAIGNGSTNDIYSLTAVSGNIAFKEVSLGKSSTLLISNTTYTPGFSLGIATNGDLYSWGGNKYGQLGNNKTSTTATVLTPTKVASSIQKVSAGQNHCIALNSSGKLLTWGSATSGKLGNGSTSGTVTSPTQLNVSTTFKEISAGYSHSIAIDKDGYLWSWGSASSGKLGNNNTSTTVKVPTKVPNMPSNIKFTKISAGYDHNLAIDTNGNIWSWGANTKGQLGRGFKVANLNNLNTRRVTSRAGITITNTTVKVPTQITTGTKFIDISCGYQYSMFIDENGNLYGCGLNDFGQLGTGNNEDQKTVTKITIPNNQPVLKVSATVKHTLIIDAQENIRVFGNNAYGQLGNNYTSPLYSPTVITKP